MIYAIFKTDIAKASEIKDFYHAEEIKDEKYPYDFFDAEKDGVHIHASRNKKEIYTIVFSGRDEEKVKESASLFSSSFTLKEYEEKEGDKKRDIAAGWEDLGPQIGSDEVGKGDFFGPLIVTASYVDEKDIPLLERLGIDDSKKMKDEDILALGPTLKRRYKTYTVLLSPKKLSSLYRSGFNMDHILSLSHNHAQRGLIEKYDLTSDILVYIDQFVPENDYRRYLKDDVIPNPLYFRTKGETYYPSVALSSVVSRYTFLKEWKKMEEVFHTEIPKGASATVDKVYGRLKNQYGEETLLPYIKTFFANYKNSKKSL